MKCLIFSDSHGSYYNMKAAIERHRDAEAIFFLGDGLSDIREIRLDYPNIALFAVRGNCDFSRAILDGQIEKTERVNLLGKKIVITHGDLFSAKSTMAGLESLAVRERADIVLFGHTHEPYLSYVNTENIENGEDAINGARGYCFYLFNPGSISNADRSYGILTLSEGKEPLFSHGRV